MSTRLHGRYFYFDARAAERRLIDIDHAAVELHQLAHHRQTDSLPRHALVQTCASLQYSGSRIQRNARTIVLDDEPQTVASGRGTDDPVGGDPDCRAGPLEGVVEQVAGN